MKKELVLLTLAFLLHSCGNKSQEAEPVIYDDNPIVEQVGSDTVATVIQNEGPKVEEEPSVHASPPSTSRSNRSGSNDNMRGFDPASEDDMDDNGMSRYMENNDEEGWD